MDSDHTRVRHRLDELIEAGVRHHQAGDLGRAGQAYRQVLELDPAHPDALHLLGRIAHKTGDLDAAADLVARALDAEPDSALLHTSLADIYRDRGELREAIDRYRHALGIDPSHAEAHLGLGAAFQTRGDLAQAIEHYERFLGLRPGRPEVHYNLGIAYQSTGDVDAAVRHYRDALALRPDDAAAHHRLGSVLLRTGERAAALKCFARAAKIKPDFVEAWLGQGNLLLGQARFDEALRCCRQALDADPGSAQACNCLGSAYKALGRPQEAASYYSKAVEIDPGLVDACHNLGLLFRDHGACSEAIGWFERALAVQPDHAQAFGSLVCARQEICCWDDYPARLERLAAWTKERIARGQGSPLHPFCAVTLPLSPALQQAVARKHAQAIVAAGLPEPGFTARPGDRNSGRLRIGYVSSDFHAHATAQLMLSLFGLHDRNEFEIFVYSFGRDDGSHYRARIMADAEHFIDVAGEHYLDTARRIVADGINILVDLKGYTRDVRPEIFALRPAPIQVNYLGFPGTMGAEFIDYIITDRVVTPPAQAEFLSEQPVYLPHSYQVNDHQQPIAEDGPSRSECGLPDNAFVFCCFNNSYKIEPTLFDVWMRILVQVPGSVLWLLRTSPAAQGNLRREAQTRGIDPQRLVFAERIDRPRHLARHRHADLFLDTRYCNAHTTASDALWAGLPLITCPGETFAARVAASLLTAVGLPELIVPDLNAYQRLAVELATRPDQLERIKGKLGIRRASAPLFDTPRFARHLEDAYRRMWERFEQGQAPRSISVPDHGTSMEAGGPTGQTGVAQMLDAALHLQQAGDAARAEQLCRQVLEIDAGNLEALLLLAQRFRAAGKPEPAQEYLQRALSVAPDLAPLHVVLGHLSGDRGDLEAAHRAYRQAIAHDPGNAEAHAGLGVTLQRQGDLEAAVGAYRQALSLNPRYAEVQYNLAVALDQLGGQQEAAGSYRKAIELNPANTGAYINLGNILMAQGDLDAAFEHYAKVLAFEPDNADIYFKLGGVRQRQLERRQAAEYYRKALTIDPSIPGVHNNLGNALKADGDLEGALACYRQAITLAPESSDALNNLGLLHREQGLLSQAQECFTEALRRSPDDAASLTNLLLVCQDTCRWGDRDRLLQKVLALMGRPTAGNPYQPFAPFMFLASPLSPAEQQEIARSYTEHWVKAGLGTGGPLHRVGRETPGKLRIGYVSPNFRDHPTSHLMVGLFELHDHDDFEIYVYSHSEDDGSEYRRRIAAAADHFVDIAAESPAATARRIAGDGIHILVDRAGYTFNARSEIFAFRPAPIQVNYIGFPGTLGADFIDYIVTDRVVTAPGLEQFLTEQPVYMPHSYLVTDHRPSVADITPSRADCGLPGEGFVFCSFNNNLKIEPTIFDLWMWLLRQVPDSVLWLLRSSPEAEENLRREAAARGIADGRLIFAERRPKDFHLARHRLADLFLDTLYYNAHTTAVDALYMGLPVVTCPGEGFASRVAASLLTAAGLTETIAADLQEYERLALRLARRPEELRRLRERVGGCRHGPLFDTPRYTRDLEQAFRMMWELHARGEAFRPIQVPE